MAEYFVHHTGDNSTGASWATAFTSVDSADTAVAFASGDILNIGHDHVCPVVHAASLTITGPSSGLPVIFRSVTTGSDPVTYQKGTGTQIDTSEAATYDVVLDGSFALYGILIQSGRDIRPAADTNETFYCSDCTLAPGAAGTLNIGSDVAAGLRILKNTVVDLTQDGSTNRATGVFSWNSAGTIVIDGMSFINAGFRTGFVFGGAAGEGTRIINGVDLSGFTNASPCEIFLGQWTTATITNCKTASTFTLYNAAVARVPGHTLLATNVGPTDDPTSLRYVDYFGDIVSSTSIYRSGGATIEGIANSWLVTTTANCNEYAPFHSPWMPSRVATAGTKNFDVFISNDTADFTDAQVWIELERLATAGSPLWTLASDQRATITTTPVDQDDDTTSTWVGSGPAFTFKQRLRITAAVEPGQYRVRVVTGVASIASSRNFYVDPDVTVT